MRPAHLHTTHEQLGSMYITVSQHLVAGQHAKKLSNYQLAKLRQLFQLFDVKDDGVISEEEFWAISSRMATAAKAPGLSASGKNECLTLKVAE